MQIQKYKNLTIFAVLAALLTACTGRLGPVTSTQASTNPPPTAQQTATAVPPTASPAGLCANPLVPIEKGATWTYTTSSAAAPETFTATVTDLRPDGFTVATKFEDSSAANQDWLCKPEGLMAQSPGAGDAGLGFSMGGIQAKLAASNAAGVTLPSSVQPGMTWPYTLDLAGSISQGSLSATLAGNVVTSFQAMGTESVTVPAGTFDATKIQAASTFKVSADYHGLSLPITSVINTTFWFAPGVGWIKASSTGELAGTSLNTTTELQSFSLP